MSKIVTFAAAGDSFITRRLPCKERAFNEISSVIKKAQVRFTNLEVTVHDYEGFPSAVAGGTWAIAPPYVLGDLKEYGFNLLSTPNNHTLDYSHEGLIATERYLNQYGFVHAGSGINLAKASSPAYLDCPSGRTALIAATSTFHESWVAGEQRRDAKGRPGINPLRYTVNYMVGHEKMRQLREIAEITNINAYNNLMIKEGFYTKHEEDVFMFGNYRFKESEDKGCETKPLQKDVTRITNAISEAKRQADYVIVSIHSHEMSGDDKSRPAGFLMKFAKECIDAGAHAVIGHGPHILRGIEIYKKRPIFYSIGNFIFQSETVDSLPSDFYDKYGLGYGNNLADALDARTCKDTKGLGANPEVWESVIPFWSMEDGKLVELVLYPVELGYGLPRYKRGWPVLSKNTSILGRLAEMSKQFCTNIKIDELNGKGIVKIDK